MRALRRLFIDQGSKWTGALLSMTQDCTPVMKGRLDHEGRERARRS